MSRLLEDRAIDLMEAIDARDLSAALACLAPGATAIGGIFTTHVPAAAALHLLSGLWRAMTDFSIAVTAVDADESTAIVRFRWGGTHDGAFQTVGARLPFVPATGQRIWVEDALLCTFEAGGIAVLYFVPPPAGGIAAALAQMGVGVPVN